MNDIKKWAIAVIVLCQAINIWFFASFVLGVVLLVLFIWGTKYLNMKEMKVLMLFYAYIIFIVVLLIGRVVYVDANCEKTLINSEVLREVRFADDTLNMSYKVGATEYIHSTVLDSTTYYQNKSTYSQRYMPDRNDTYQENCYLNSYNYKYSWFFDMNDVNVECY